MFAVPGRRPLESPFRLAVVASPALDQAEPESDIRALILEHVISVTPLGWDMSANAAWREAWLMTDGEDAPTDGSDRLRRE